MKIAIIGAGSMGGALAKGFVKSGFEKPSNINVTTAGQGSADTWKKAGYSAYTSEFNIDAVLGADIVILAVKPWLASKVLKEIVFMKSQTVVSVMAGVGKAELSSAFNNNIPGALYLAMPNIAAANCQGVTFLAPAWDNIGGGEKVTEMFEAVGRVFLTDEKHLGAGTALASCGIAYALRYLRAATEGGVQLGFKADVAREIVAQTLAGAVSLLESEKVHPEELIDRVTTPGGLTIRGLNAMEEAGFTNAVIKGLLA